jgi:RNA polymerase sigma-70 factor (ECF subfamily)
MDERAFFALYEETRGSLRAYVAKSLGNISLADDIVQEVYLRFLRLPSPPANAPQARPYLFRMATNLMVDQWRHHQREMKAMSVAGQDESVSRDPLMRLDLGRVFLQLKPRERQLMWLAYVECATHREIGETLGLSTRSIRVLLFRARAKLARLLRESGWKAGHE